VLTNQMRLATTVTVLACSNIINQQDEQVRLKLLFQIGEQTGEVRLIMHSRKIQLVRGMLAQNLLVQGKHLISGYRNLRYQRISPANNGYEVVTLLG